MNKSFDSSFKAGRFSDLGKAGEAAEYVTNLERTRVRLGELSRARYALLNAHPGDRLLDLGCGLGDDARELAALVAPHGKVIAVDSSGAMVDEARRRSKDLAVPVEYTVGDAHELDFADTSFAACWSERVLQHLAEPGRAIAEMVRVIRPGGRLVVFEPDHATLVIDSADRAASKAIVQTLADSIRSSWIGRSLFGLFKANGLKEVEVTPTPIVSYSLSDTNLLLRLDATAQAAVHRGLITEQAAAQWFADLAERESAGSYFGCLLCFTAAGRKP
jgi:ubiquinone/menaquinone biosynthesis C-methylase UbiE